MRDNTNEKWIEKNARLLNCLGSDGRKPARFEKVLSEQKVPESIELPLTRIIDREKNKGKFNDGNLNPRLRSRLWPILVFFDIGNAIVIAMVAIAAFPFYIAGFLVLHMVFVFLLFNVLIDDITTHPFSITPMFALMGIFLSIFAYLAFRFYWRAIGLENKVKGISIKNNKILNKINNSEFIKRIKAQHKECHTPLDGDELLYTVTNHHNMEFLRLFSFKYNERVGVSLMLYLATKYSSLDKAGKEWTKLYFEWVYKNKKKWVKSNKYSLPEHREIMCKAMEGN